MTGIAKRGGPLYPGSSAVAALDSPFLRHLLNASRRDVGQILIADALAVPFKCSTTRCPPTPKPWCNN